MNYVVIVRILLLQMIRVLSIASIQKGLTRSLVSSGKTWQHWDVLFLMQICAQIVRT